MLPAAGAIDTRGLDITDATMQELLSLKKQGWLEDVPKLKEHFARFGDRLPAELNRQLETLERELNAG